MSHDIKPNIKSDIPLLLIDGEETIEVKILEKIMNSWRLTISSSLFWNDEIFHVSREAGNIFLEEISELWFYILVVPG